METNPFRRSLDGWTADSWIKGKLYHAEHYLDGSRREITGWCAVARLADFADLDMNTYPEAYGLLEDLFTDMFPDRAGDEFCHAIPCVNDDKRTTFEDVRSVFEKAAAKWDERL